MPNVMDGEEEYGLVGTVAVKEPLSGPDISINSNGLLGWFSFAIRSSRVESPRSRSRERWTVSGIEMVSSPYSDEERRTASACSNQGRLAPSESPIRAQAVISSVVPRHRCVLVMVEYWNGFL
jgi:hypothetical protein